LSRARPVFLHGVWRSATTYVWSRFRLAEGGLCYYEPLHDGLTRLTARRIGRDTPEGAAYNHHPSFDRPYFEEYRPLLAWRGVRGYRSALAYDRFALAPEQEDRALEAYVERLLAEADRRQRAAVLGFCRSSLRVGWLRRRFGAFDIAIDRDPLDIFASYLSRMRDGNFYYFAKWLLILERNRGHPLLAGLSGRARLRSGLDQWLAKPKAFYREVARETPVETLYFITYQLWLICALHSLSHADLVIDVARAEEPGYAPGLSDRIAQGCGLRVDFADFRIAAPAIALEIADREAIEAAAIAAVPREALEPFLDRPRLRERLAELSPAKARVLEAFA
jgi:hypothetical protein